METLDMSRGDTIEFPVYITNPKNITNGNPTGAVDVTGATFKFVARNYDDAVVIEKTLNDGISLSGPPSAGTIIITLTPDDTNVLDYSQVLLFDVEMTEASGRVTTVIENGLLTVLLDQARSA